METTIKKVEDEKIYFPECARNSCKGRLVSLERIAGYVRSGFYAESPVIIKIFKCTLCGREIA